MRPKRPKRPVPKISILTSLKLKQSEVECEKWALGKDREMSDSACKHAKCVFFMCECLC